jgi:Ankyrin repeats (3 copies)
VIFAVLVAFVLLPNICLGQQLDDAIRAGNAAEVRRLVASNPAAVKAKSPGATPPTILALESRRGDISILQVLLEAGADVNAATSDGTTALHIAALTGQTAAARLLLEKKANVDATDASGRTPLDFAAVRRNLEIVKLLAARGAKLNGFDTALLGWTKEAVQACKADPTLARSRKFGFEPIVLAAMHGHPETARSLEPFYASPDIFEATAALDLRHMDELLAANPKLVNSGDSAACRRRSDGFSEG